MRISATCCIIVLLCACKKNASDNPPPTPSLESSVSSFTLPSLAGSKDSFAISSNISWKVTIDPSTTSWLRTSVSSGSNDAKVYITATQDNVSQGDKTATIIISPVGTTSVQPVHIDVFQGFSTTNSAMLWQKAFGGSNTDYGNAIVATSDGNYLMAGYSASNDGDIAGSKGGGDVWLVNFKASGIINWQKTLGGTGMDRALSLINTSGGGYAFVGQTDSNDGDVSGSHGDPDEWVVKLDNAGNITWQKCLGGSKDDIGYSITETANGDLIVAGRTLSEDGDAAGYHGGADVFAARLNTNGNVVWTKVIGGSNQDVGFAVASTPDNGCIITGNTASIDGDITGVHGSADLLAVKLNNDGDIVWQKAFGGSDGEDGHAILATGDGGCIIAGGTGSTDGDVSGNHGNGDGWILKIDATGILQWEKAIGGTGNDSFNSINIDAQGKYIVAGGSDSNDGDVPSNNGDADYWAILLDPNGSVSGKNSFGGTGADEAKTIIRTSDGNYMVTGNTSSHNGDVAGYHGGTDDAWIIKFKFQ